MELLKKIKLKNVYIVLMAFYLIVVGIMCMYENSAVDLVKGSDLFETLNKIQKPISVANIVFFAVLLVVSVFIYMHHNKKMPMYLACATYSAFTLFIYVRLSQIFYQVGGDGPTSGNYWLLVFIGVIFIAGALIVSAMATIAIKNLLKHNQKINYIERKQK